MIKETYIETTWNNANRKHLMDSGYIFTKLQDRLIISSLDLQPTSNIKVEVECDNCHKIFKRQRRRLKELHYCEDCSYKMRKVPAICSCGNRLHRPSKYKKCKECRITLQTKNEYIDIGNGSVILVLRTRNNEINGYTLIDEEDLSKVMQYKWRIGTGNYIIGGKDNLTRLHRFLINCPDDMEVDHINRITIDNRKVNLKVVDRQANCKNRTPIENKRYADIKFNDVANGDGIRVSFWLQGCDLRCPNCHNESIWDFSGGKIYTQKTVKDVLSKINDNNIHRDFSILGGEPLHPKNIDVTLDMLINVKRFFPNIKIWLWTGYTFENLNQLKHRLVLQYIDVLIDGKFDINKRDLMLKHRGSENQRVIDVKESLQKNKVIIKV